MAKKAIVAKATQTPKGSEKVATKKVTKIKKVNPVKEEAPKVEEKVKKGKTLPTKAPAPTPAVKEKGKTKEAPTKPEKKSIATEVNRESKYKYPEGLDLMKRKRFRAEVRTKIKNFEKELKDAKKGSPEFIKLEKQFNSYKKEVYA